MEEIKRKIERKIKRINSGYILSELIPKEEKKEKEEFVVVAEIPEKKEYAVWDYNEPNDILFWGHYNLTLEQAKRIISEKMY